MNNGAFDEPVPRTAPLEIQRYSWEIELVEALPIPMNLEAQVGQALGRRRSERSFCRLHPTKLSTLLLNAAATHQVIGGRFHAEHRPAPSAGGLHPIHVLLIRPGESHAYRYDGRRHVIERVSGPTGAVDRIREEAGQFMLISDATILLFAAEPGVTSAKYENASSLVWRDAGVLQGQFGLVAAVMDLNFCLLGTTGGPWLTRLLGDSTGLYGTGVALVGDSQ